MVVQSVVMDSCTPFSILEYLENSTDYIQMVVQGVRAVSNHGSEIAELILWSQWLLISLTLY